MTSRARSGLLLGWLPAILAAAAFAAPAGAEGAGSAAAPKGTYLVAPDVQEDPPPVSAREAVKIASRTPEVRSERARHPDLRPQNIALYKGSRNWGISFL